MSSLWTPGGERPVPRDPGPPSSPGPSASRRPDPDGDIDEVTEEEMAAQLSELREQLARTPAEVVVANHAYGLFELAALHLSLRPPQLDQARLAIDALGALVEGLGDRLGQPGSDLQAALAQVRMAFIQVQGAASAAGPVASGEAG